MTEINPPHSHQNECGGFLCDYCDIVALVLLLLLGKLFRYGRAKPALRGNRSCFAFASASYSAADGQSPPCAEIALVLLRDDRTRTCGIQFPKLALYQTELRPD